METSMLTIKSPNNYNEMLEGLNKGTLITTFIFFVVLRYFEIIPKIIIPESLIPPLKDYKELLDWAASFGALPLAAALLTAFFSSFFEAHNKISKLLGIRYAWDKFFIIKPLLKNAKINKNLSRAEIKLAMSNFYYPEAKKIDQHYVQLFWRYAMFFWVFFEHFFVVLVTSSALEFIYREKSFTALWVYLLVLFSVTLTQWLFVTVQKSKNQAKQIPIEAVKEYFK